MIKILEAVDAEVFADTATIGSDGLIMGDSVEEKEFL